MCSYTLVRLGVTATDSHSAAPKETLDILNELPDQAAPGVRRARHQDCSGNELRQGLIYTACNFVSNVSCYLCATCNTNTCLLNRSLMVFRLPKHDVYFHCAHASSQGAVKKLKDLKLQELRKVA